MYNCMDVTAVVCERARRMYRPGLEKAGKFCRPAFDISVRKERSWISIGRNFDSGAKINRRYSTSSPFTHLLKLRITNHESRSPYTVVIHPSLPLLPLLLLIT